MRRVLIILLVFALGWLANTLSGLYQSTQVPFGSGREVSSPNDWVSDNQTTVLQNYLLIKIANATLAKYANTKSMDPVLDATTQGLEIKPEKGKLKVGDIISYKSNMGMVIVHRITEINEDEYGTYYITKGDNNAEKDIEKVRFDQIQGVVVGLIY